MIALFLTGIVFAGVAFVALGKLSVPFAVRLGISVIILCGFAWIGYGLLKKIDVPPPGSTVVSQEELNIVAGLSSNYGVQSNNSTDGK